jgi:hypothetical protein
MSDAPQAAEPQPSRVTRLLCLVRKLIDYGRELADTLRRNPGPLSAGDIAAILARITRGLQRAEALEARIVSNADRLNAKRRPTHAALRFWRPVLDLVAPLPPPPPMLLGTGPPV